MESTKKTLPVRWKCKIVNKRAGNAYVMVENKSIVALKNVCIYFWLCIYVFVSMCIFDDFSLRANRQLHIKVV